MVIPMHALPLVASSFLLISMLGSPAFAQAKKSPAPAPTVRYFQFSGDLLGDLPIDAFLKEVRQGGRVVAAVLDVCHSIEDAEPRKDRFVVELKPEADRLTGSGRSQEENVPVSVDLGRRQNGPTVSFTGSITRDRTRALEVNGRSWDADGILSARYWSEAAREHPEPPRLVYFWRGERPRQPDAPELEGTGEIRLETVDRARGY